MSRYIDVTNLSKQIADFKRVVTSPNSDYMTGYLCALSVTEGIIAETPAADVVEVIRCGQCKHWKINPHNLYGGYCRYSEGASIDHYCSYGERREK